MNASPTATPRGPVWQLLSLARNHRRLLIYPTAICTLLALGFAILRTPQWKASQALLVRDEANGALGRHGRFDSSDAMKTAQETIAEISRNQAVAKAALIAIGPPSGRSAANWPLPADIEAFLQNLSLSAPKGQEFGRSEVIYLAVVGPTRERAIQLTTSVCDQLESRLKELRDHKARSIAAELKKTVDLAQRDLEVSTKQLATLEADVGSDLGELRILNDSGAGDSNLRTLHTQVRNELRQARLVLEAAEEQLRLLTLARKSPDSLLAAPKGLLDAHPSLRRLKDGLVDAQLRTAQLLGKMSNDHPEVRGASAAEEVIRGQLRDEVTALMIGLKADLQVNQAQIAALEKQQSDVEARLNRLAALRANYSNLVAQSKQCSESLERAKKDLADARASQASAQSASLITRLDTPVAGDRPEGPGKSLIVLAGAIGGLTIGIALIFLLTPSASGGRRWSDLLPRGRRATDRAPLRRETDRSQANPVGALPPGEERRSGGDRRSGGTTPVEAPPTTPAERRRS